jgi:hypothetical protein
MADKSLTQTGTIVQVRAAGSRAKISGFIKCGNFKRRKRAVINPHFIQLALEVTVATRTKLRRSI